MGILARIKLKPAGYTTASLCLSLGGFLNGYDTGSAGAVTVMPQFVDSMGEISPTMVGFTISVILLGGAIPSVFAGQLADRYGRLAIITTGALVFLIGCVLQASALSLAQFIAGRVVAGIGEGTYLGMVNVYICEIAPSSRRGLLASIPQLLVAVGICCGYFTCYGTVSSIESSMAWRLPFIIGATFAVTMAVSCLFLPHSPRWLMLEGKREEALRAVEWLGIQSAEAEKDIFMVKDEQERRRMGILESIRMVFSAPYRSRTVLALFILGMMQLCGIDGIIFYAPHLFSQAGLPEHTAGFLASGLSAVLICAISIPAAIFADRWGRRTSFIFGGTVLAGTMFLMGLMYAAGAVHATGSGRWVVIIAIFVFALTYASTWAMVGKMYASEIQPGLTRSTSNALAQGLNFLTNGIVALITPILLAHSAYGAYFLFGGLTLITLIALAMYMPETRGEPLEKIQEVFSKPLQLQKPSGSFAHFFGKRETGKASGEMSSIELERLAI